MKKVKKDKNKNEHIQKTWSVWLTIILVVLGIGVISGVTVLGVYLTGGFEESEINPEEGIDFARNDEFNALYNESLNQLEVTDNFSLTITSPSQYVTADEVTLSFENYDAEPYVINGISFIDDGYIRVPQYVTIGQEFEVTLITDNYLTDSEGNAIEEEWIVGGISHLVGKSEYDLINPCYLQIAVDVPVYSIELEAVDENGEFLEQILAGDSFYLRANFIPASSYYNYSDDKNDDVQVQRVKYVYYQPSSALSVEYENRYVSKFTVGNDSEGSISLNGYVAKNAYSQELFEELILSESENTITDENFYNEMLSLLTNPDNDEVVIPTSYQNEIGQAVIGRFSITNHNLTMYPNKTFTLYANRYVYDRNASYLGASIYSTSENRLYSLLRNIGIAFDYQGSDPTTREDAFLQVSGADYIEIDGTRYYRPNAKVPDLNNSYWTLRSSRVAEITMTVVLLEENDGVYNIFGSEDSDVWTVSLSINQIPDTDVQWSDNSTIEVMLDYKEDHTIEHLDSLAQRPEENVFQDYVLFAWFGEGDKEEISKTVNSVIGSNGYYYDYSGIYATNTENLLLFALKDNTTVNLQNTGTFRLYFATVVDNNGSPVVEEDINGNESYSIVRMSTNYITVVCEKALYQDSVTGNGINAERFTALENGEIAINQGTTQTLDVSFIVNAESIPVFTDEYNSGYISLKMEDLQGIDITSYFIVGQPTFTPQGETGNTILNYELAINTGVTISTLEGIYINRAVLVYDNGEDPAIKWYNNASDNISIYSPIAENISIDTSNNYQYLDYINGNQTIIVSQSLTPEGNFDTTIDVGGIPFTSVTDLLNALLGTDNSLITITDQKNRSDTLVNSWEFRVVGGSSNALNLNGQTFTFRQADNAEVTLALVSLDGNASSVTNGQTIRLSISSEGITFAQEAVSTDPYTINESYQEANISNLIVMKYGAQSDSGITLQNLVRFYIDGDNITGRIYNNLRFRLSQQYLNDSTIDDSMMVDLFGTDGMISLFDEDGILIEGLDGSGASIRQALSGQNLSRIVINKNFAIDHILRFSITDTGPNGAINSTLSLTLMTTVSLSRENYPNENTDSQIYATEQINLVNTIYNSYLESLNNTNYDKSFASLYDNSTYYIVSSGSSYILQSTDTANSVGSFSQGTIVFKDFWNVEYNDYTINFAPEDNYFTINQSISFRIYRDLVIENNNTTYYVLNESVHYNIGNFISTNRASTGQPVAIIDATAPVFEVSYAFSEYFTVEGASNSIIKLDDEPFVFGYNQTSLSTTLSIYYIQRNTNNEIINRILLGEVEVPIELNSTYQNNDYSHIAQDLLFYDPNYQQRAEIQTINGVDYLVVQQGTWFLNRIYTNTNNTNYYIYANSRDGEQSFSYYYTTISGAEKTIGEGVDRVTLTGTSITFRNPNDNIFQGLGDNTLYLVLYFGNSTSGDDQPTFPGNTAVMYLPLIITSIGYNYVEYDSLASFGIEDSEKLAITMTNPDTLIVDGVYQGPYDTITAGQLTQILHHYDFASTELTENGLYLLSSNNLVADIEYYPLTSTANVQTAQDILKLVNLEVDGIILNHLSQAYDNFYLALKYTISSTSDNREFYYVLKVLPDVIVEQPVYAYNGNIEYITSEEGINSVDLDAIYGETTLNENKKRFNITKLITLTETYNQELDENEVLTTINIDAQTDISLWLKIGNSSNYQAKLSEQYITLQAGERTLDLANYVTNLSSGDIVSISIVTGQATISYNDVLVFSTLLYTNEVESVYIGEDPYLSSSDWERYITITFSEDYSIMYYTLAPTVNEQVTINIRHRYLGGFGDSELEVVGGDQTYTIVVNTTSYNYSVRFTNGQESFITSRENQTYVWDIDEEDLTEVTEEGLSYNQATINIHLLENALAGSSQEYTEIWNILQIQLTDENATTDFVNSALIENGVIYSSAQENGGRFELRFAEYITSDRQLEFTLYTQQGYLASLIVNINATARAVQKETTISGGTTANLADLFDLSIGGEALTDSDYSVSAVITSTAQDNNGFSGKDFVQFDSISGGSFVVGNLIQDYQITCVFTLTFNNNIDASYNNQTYTFTANFTLKANISYNNNVTGGNVIAGSSKEIDLNAIFNTLTAENTEITFEESSSGEAYRGIAVQDGVYSILTNYVSLVTPLDVRLRVKVYFNYDGQYQDLTTAPFQTFVINYSLTVAPSVKLEDNYPAPAGEQLSYEYIDSGSHFENILRDFILHTPIFAENSNSTRIVIQSAEEVESTITYNSVLTYDAINSTFASASGGSITVISTQNASVYSAQNGEGRPVANSNFIQNATIPYDSPVYFSIGNWTTDAEGNVSLVDNGSEARIILRFTYQNVTIDYNIYLLNSSITVTTNYASKNIESGTYEDAIVSYENIFIDQTNINNLFAQNRMAKIVYSNSLSGDNTYYLVFTDGNHFYASYPLFISQEDSGTSVTVDLGNSMASADGENYTYVGAYYVQAFENADLAVTDNGLIVNGVSDIEITSQSELGVNIDSNHELLQSLQLASRVQLIYGGTNGVEVAYSRFKSVLAPSNLSGETDTISAEIDTISAINFFSDSLDKNDGSQNSSLALSTRYYFKPSIDINVLQQATSEYGAVALSVNRQYDSMIETFGIVHPSTGEYLNSSEFNSNTSITLDIISYSSGSSNGLSEEMQNILNGYLSVFNETEFKTITTQSSKVYLYVSARLNAGGHIYDYRLLPQGADNQGDLVLVEITYQVGEYSKVFYVVVQVLPDYRVAYNDLVVENDYQSDVISNSSNVYNISETIALEDGTVVYQPFTLTSDQGLSGYVSVRHTYGGNNTNQVVTTAELATSNFTITLTSPGSVIGGVEYNNSENVRQKLGKDLGENWSRSSSGSVTTYTLTSGNTTFTRAYEVVFGTQYFILEAVDDFGFRYQVYFSLESSNPEPTLQNDSLSLVEGSYIDFSSEYQLLTVNSTGSVEDGNDQYFISGRPNRPTSSSINLIEIGGIEAYLFDSNPVGIGGISATSTGYTIDPDEQAKWTSYQEDSQYLDIPLIAGVTITEIAFYDPETNELVSEIIDLSDNNNTYTIATSENGVYNGYKPRDPYNREENLSELKTVPRITKTDIYADGNTAQVQMVIRLKYENGNNTEYYDLSSRVSIIREVSIMQATNNAIRDGVAFEVADEFNISSPSLTAGVETTFTNDTLEVLINAGSETSFELRLYDGSNLLAERVVTDRSNTGRSVARTVYYSISQLLGINVMAGYRLQITPLDNNATFYYITNEVGDIVNNVGTGFTIEQIVNDAIYIEDASLLETGNYHSVEKYYIANVMVGGNTYSYQTSKTYFVTGYYYTLARTDNSIIMNRLEVTDTDGQKTSTFSQWNSAFTMTYAGLNGEALLIEDEKSNYTDYLVFSLDASDPLASGNASVNSDGTITYGQGFTRYDYINIAIRMRVSGADRSFNTQDDTFILMETLSLSWAQDYNNP